MARPSVARGKSRWKPRKPPERHTQSQLLGGMAGPTGDWESLDASREDFEPSLKSELFKRGGALAVIEGIVGVEPVALSVDFEVCHLSDLMVLDEELPFRYKRCDEADFGLIEMELVAV